MCAAFVSLKSRCTLYLSHLGGSHDSWRGRDESCRRFGGHGQRNASNSLHHVHLSLQRLGSRFLVATQAVRLWVAVDAERP